jgi:uncharacterized protein (TIRG00374 family)
VTTESPSDPASDDAVPHHPVRLSQLIGLIVAAVLVAAVLAIARPATVWQLLSDSDPRYLALAAASAGAALVMKGARLIALVGPGRLGVVSSSSVAAAAQAAALFAPARLGELALPWLLHRVAGRELAAGLGTLLATRALDLAALGVWTGLAVLAVSGLDEPLALLIAAVLVVPSLVLPLSLAMIERLVVRLVAPRGLRGRRWARRVRRLSRAVTELGGRPLRLAVAALASLAMWAWLWALAWFLLAAMGYRWPVAEVVAGSAGASLSNLLPINVFGNMGTLEAGWTAAFVALGYPLDIAAATGLASHLWALLFAAGYGAIGWLAVTRTVTRSLNLPSGVPDGRR